MRMVGLIEKKRDGAPLTEAEYAYWVQGYVRGDIPDYQVSALLMAIFFQGMSETETFYLTDQMIKSGLKLDFSDLEGFKVDKHSTGGVGDKTSLVMIPLAAAVGLKTAKMSGRGLGMTGGTIDKLESIPGYQVELSVEELKKQVQNSGLGIISQSEELVKADKLLYSLRDVTGTVDSMPLIAASIISKKIAAGSDLILLDVKYGRGAFMKQKQQARDLAGLMVNLAARYQKKAVALISPMEQPLGQKVGNALEVEEAAEILQNKLHNDVLELSLLMVGKMLELSGSTADWQKGVLLARQKLEAGEAWQKFLAMVKSQNGDWDMFVKRKKPCWEKQIRSDRDGFLTECDAGLIGEAMLVLGAGRERKGQEVDLDVGICFNRKVGGAVVENELLLTIWANDKKSLQKATDLIKKAISIKDMPISRNLVVDGIVDPKGYQEMSEKTLAYLLGTKR